MTTSDNTAKTEAPAQQFAVQRIYLKDLSFEAPLGAQAFLEQLQPKVDQELGTETKKVADDLYEMTLRLTITAKTNDKTTFLVEVQQAGLFLMKGIDAASLTRVLNTVCPQILFPYAREAIDSALVKGSFPPLLLPPVNFEALYDQALAEKQQKGAAH